jgi:hypothetical protein
VDTNRSSATKPFEAPGGLDLHPQPEEGVHISRRAGMAILSVIVVLLVAFAYGGYRRTLLNQAAARDASLPKSVTPATQAGTEFLRATPTGTVPLTHANADELRPPEATASPATCGADPKTGQPDRFNPQSGQPCEGFLRERVGAQQPNAVRSQPVTPTPIREETPKQRRLAAAYE